ncbi:MAG TPA: FAD-dependent oxidoreductase [Bryobacteraceae bacterium]|nr:FAD-dependent oxidoreductase [Bryobacteraceae bacterium]
MPIRDATIIGAGLIGASIAWRLAQAGVRVALIDAGLFGGETSSAGAGMLSPGGEFDGVPGWHPLAVDSMSLYPDFVDELRMRTKLLIDFQICGSFKFPQKGGDAIHYPGDGFVDPTHLLRALRAVCLARAVRIFEHQPVTAFDSDSTGALVIAAGAWSNQLEITHSGRRLDLPPVKPIKGHLIGFDFEPGTLGPMLRCGHSYVLQRSNGFLVAGSTEEDVGFDRTVDPEICADIHRRATELCPSLDGLAPSKSWIGFRPFSELPNIGRVDGTNVWLAYGHFRNGILLTPLTAARIASEITSR